MTYPQAGLWVQLGPSAVPTPPQTLLDGWPGQAMKQCLMGNPYCDDARMPEIWGCQQLPEPKMKLSSNAEDAHVQQSQ